MSKCACIYATCKNTSSVRSGHEMGGYLKTECDSCRQKKHNQEGKSPMITDILREHETGNGFTLTTPDCRRAFDMAEKMAFSGKHYSIKLGKEPGKNWVVVVDEVQS